MRIQMIQMEPIGIFRSEAKHPYEARRQADENSPGELVLRAGLEQAAEDLEGFERVWIVYMFDRNADWKPKVMPPRGPRVKRGVFATRAPHRPNPIGLSCVKLVKVDGLHIHIEGHDLLDGTPILDIKPYLPYADAFPESKVGWLENVDAEKWKIEFSRPAQEQLAWLEAAGLSQIRGFLIGQLEFDPLDHKRKRVEAALAPEHFVLSYRTWRARFRVDSEKKTIEVTEIFSGYSAADLSSPQDPYGDKDLHRRFGARASHEAAKPGALADRDRNFQWLVDNSPAIIWITNSAAECTYLSKKWYEITGRTPEQDLGFGWVENCHPDDREAAAKAFFTAVESRGKISIRYRLRHQDGSYRWAIDSGLPLNSDTGEFLGYIGTVVDIHDQVASEEELIELNERFRRSSQAVDLGVWYCDLPFDELIWNKEVKNHFMMPPDARVTIEDFYAHIHPDDREPTRRAIQFSNDNHAPYDIIYRTMNPANPARLKWIRAIGWTDYDLNGNPIRFDGITLDVTTEHFRQLEIKNARDAAESARRVAETANESKSRFLANMSHEIRTPISAIVGFSDLLRARIGPDDEANSYIERISRNSTQLSRLIDELLDLSKIEANHLEVESTPIDLEAVIEDTRAAMTLRAQRKGLALNFRWTTPKPARVVTDPIRLSQILINVVGNAVKFTERGSVEVEFSFGQGRLRARVSDTGIGLSVEQQRKIFEPFMQADSTVTRKYGGTGLGLALAKRLAVLLGGNLTLESSSLGAGSTFLIEVMADLAETNKANSVSASPSAISAQDHLKGKTILVVDDSPDNRMLIQLYMRAAGALVEEAENGQAGIEAAITKGVDVVLMDIQMPVMDGYAALTKLKDMGYQKPVIALTAHAFKEERDRCLAAGFTRYLTKPVDRALLMKTVIELAAPKTP